jgi:hypothetical protein
MDQRPKLGGKSIKLVEENVVDPHEFGLGHGFSDITPKSKNKNSDFCKI